MLKRLAFTILALTLTVSYSFAADYTEPTTGIELVKIPSGKFLMGDLYGSDQYAKPTHKVSLPEFYIGKHEVTFEQFEAFCKATKRDIPSDQGWGRGDRPVINVTHADAVAFTEWLSKQSGKTFRLPSEAEWEYAARAGKSTHFWWGMTIGEANAVCANCGTKWDNHMTAPVGSLKPNPYGVHDMYGNVYEWVTDSWHENYQGAPVDGSAWINDKESQKVSRGGSWLEIPSSLYAHARNWSDGGESRKDIGFRVVMEP